LGVFSGRLLIRLVAFARQHAIPLKKLEFEHMHTMLMLEHPPISDPLVNSATFFAKVNQRWHMYRAGTFLGK
jgi:hypothetical protein